MAIDEKTAALVAAQLAVAWATRTGPARLDPARPEDSVVAQMYLRFKSAIEEVPIKG